MLIEFTTLSVFHFFLIFTRVGTAFMFIPGIGEIFVSPRVRLLFALAFTLILTPILSPTLPPVPSGPIELGIILSSEVLIGGFIGGLARMIQSALHTAGMIIAFQSGLAAAQLFDTSQGTQGTVISSFMVLLGLTLLLVTDLHHMLLMGVVESYHLFRVGGFLPVDDLLYIVSDVLAQTFIVAVKIAAPQVVIGLLLYLSAGIMARLMPTMQVFFILIPFQIILSFYIMLITLSAAMMWYLDHYNEVLNQLFGS